jgi:tetratricopeptide (TPR) repeat protein
LQTRQQFRQQLENATINPHDADAQFQLGLIYEQRRQYDEAVQRYRRAIEIDKSDPDPLFHLGRIERERGDVDAAYEHLSAAARLNPKHSLYEVQRELGAVAVDRKDWTNAHNLLAFYVDQRPYDPEGLYYLGFTLEQQGAQAEAHAIYTRAVEAVDTAPSNRRGMLRKWKSLAKEGLKRLP